MRPRTTNTDLQGDLKLVTGNSRFPEPAKEALSEALRLRNTTTKITALDTSSTRACDQGATADLKCRLQSLLVRTDLDSPAKNLKMARSEMARSSRGVRNHYAI